MYVIKNLLILLCSVLCSSHEIIFPGEGESTGACTVGRTKGFCVPIEQCPTALSDGNKSSICGFKSKTKLVCCTNKDLFHADLQLCDENNLPAAPNLIYQCGRFQNRFSDFSLFRKRRSNLSVKKSEELIPKQKPDIHLPPPVAGGEDSQKKEWPWMALLGTSQRDGGDPHWFCSAVLINERWLLTAAHCFRIRIPDVVRLGEHDYSTTADNSPHVDYGVERTVVYPDYKGAGQQSQYHDLALIKLNRNVQLSAWVWPICMPWGSTDPPSIGSDITVTGWGATEFYGDNSPILQKAVLEVFSTERCNESYSKPLFTRLFPKGITSDTFICAGHTDGGVDACQGDSGGPVVYLGEDSSSWVLAGIVSQGYGCGLKQFPGLYVPVHQSRYLCWVKNIAFV